MSAVNPYLPPTANVRDVPQPTEEFSTPKVWAARGRIGRLRLLSYLGVGYGVALACVIALSIVAAVMTLNLGPAAAILIGVLVWLLFIPYFVLSVLAFIQRAHDMGWSGWTVLLCLIPLVALVWIFNPGTPGANRHGAPPPPNGTGVKVGAWTILLIPVVIGLMTLSVMTAYQGYTDRNQGVLIREQMRQMERMKQDQERLAPRGE